MKYYRTTILLIICVFFSISTIAQVFSNKTTIVDEGVSGRAAWVTDIDGDSFKDVIAIDNFDGRLVWYKNLNGQGFMGANEITPFVNQPWTVHCTDLDGDNDQDVLVLGGFSTINLRWYINDGTGNFSSAGSVGQGNGSGASIIRTGDIDMDGDQDVLIVRPVTDEIVWHRNDGTGALDTAIVITSLVDNPSSAELIDMDGDGDSDLLSSSTDDNKIAWYENDGTGGYGPQMIITTSANYPTAVQAADMDNDGDIDVVYSSFNDSIVAWIPASASGLFGASQTISDSLYFPGSLLLKDLNQDGNIDILRASRMYGRGLAWHVNTGNGQFAAEQVISLSGSNSASLFVEDLNADGIADLVMSSSITDVLWFKGDGMNSYSIEQPINTSVNGLKAIDCVDLNGDGSMDLVSASSAYDKIAWYPNDGNGNFIGQNTIHYINGAIDVDHADIDGDGDYDVVSAVKDGDIVGWYENDGSGNFSSIYAISGPIIDPILVAVGDIDGDGDQDVLCTTENNVYWSANNGDGTFAPRSFINYVGSDIRTVLLEDVDADGDLDIVLGAFGIQGALDLMKNDGMGSFSPKVNIWVYSPWDLTMSDIDLDGDLDYVYGVYFNDEVHWIENNGNGLPEFPVHVIATNVDGPRGIRCGDIDGDGDQDVAVVIRNTGDVFWYQNDGYGGFGAPDTIEFYDISEHILLEDIDGDFDLDAIVGSELNDHIWSYRNLGQLGCTDSTACNYNPHAVEDNGSCCYTTCGCSNPLALNYNSAATCNDGSCMFQITTRVFVDVNANGFVDSTDFGVPNASLFVLPDSNVFISDSLGYFPITQVTGLGQKVFRMNPDTTFPSYPTPYVQSFNLDSVNNIPDTILFALNYFNPTFGSEVHFYAPGSIYPCDEYVTHDLCINNTGNTFINGLVELKIDSLFQSFSPISSIDSANGNRIYLSFDSLAPGDFHCMQIDLKTPTVANIGSFLTSTIRVTAFNDTAIFAIAEKELSVELACAYDPNDKQVFPTGYGLNHLVQTGESLDYLVRFQNTGNAPATNVLVRDTLDVGFDLGTFELLTSSHPVSININGNNRVAEFNFQNIMLPDSVNDEPNSHGFFSYRIRHLSNLPLLTELNNTASIYFDNNPPIITNTTWSTLYDCSLFQVAFSNQGAVLTASQGDSYQWYLNGAAIPGATSMSYTALTSGDYSVSVSVEFPCTDSSSSTFIVASIDEFEGETILLFPNPFTYSAVLNLGNVNGDVRNEVYDISGKLVRSNVEQVVNGRLELQRGSLSTGSYRLVLYSVGQETLTIPFVVQ